MPTDDKGLVNFLGRNFRLSVIPVDRLVEPKRDSRYFRDELWEGWLSEDLEKEGVIVPLIVRPLKSDSYEIIDGVTRYHGALDKGMSKLPCLVVELSDEDKLIERIKVNVNRKRGCYVAIASDMLELRESHGYKNKDLAERFGYSDAWICKLLALNKLDDEYKDMVADGSLSVNDAYRIVATERISKVSDDVNIDKLPTCDACGRELEFFGVPKMVLCLRCKHLLDARLDELRREREARLERQDRPSPQQKIELS